MPNDMPGPVSPRPIEAAPDCCHGRDPPPEDHHLRGQDALRPVRQDLQRPTFGLRCGDTQVIQT